MTTIVLPVCVFLVRRRRAGRCVRATNPSAGAACATARRRRTHYLPVASCCLLPAVACCIICMSAPCWRRPSPSLCTPRCPPASGRDLPHRIYRFVVLYLHPCPALPLHLIAHAMVARRPPSCVSRVCVCEPPARQLCVLPVFLTAALLLPRAARPVLVQPLLTACAPPPAAPRRTSAAAAALLLLCLQFNVV